MDGPITVEEVEKALGAPLARLHEQIYQLRQQRLDALIRKKLLAGEALKRGISAQGLLDAVVTSKVALVTEQDIETFYQANKAQLKGRRRRFGSRSDRTSRTRSSRRKEKPS